MHTPGAASSGLWQRLAAAHGEICAFRDATLDQWHRQVRSLSCVMLSLAASGQSRQRVKYQVLQKLLGHML